MPTRVLSAIYQFSRPKLTWGVGFLAGCCGVVMGGDIDGGDREEQLPRYSMVEQGGEVRQNTAMSRRRDMRMMW